MTNTDKQIVVLGGRGMLGTDIVKVCEQNDIKAEVLDLPQFDITDAEQLKEAVAGSEIVVNCAAYTNVEKAESEPELAYKVNAEAVGRLGRFAKVAGAKVLHISTDFVFDGKSSRPYVEADATNPINTYGKTKLAGEQLLVESGCQFCIIRVEWTYGRAGNNFVKKLIERARSGRPLRVVDDQIGSPTATFEAAKAICELLPNLPEGIFHFAAAGYVSRYETARFIFDRLGMSVNLASCRSSDYPSAAARPLNSRFNRRKIEALLGEPIKPWKGPLEHFLEQL
jgi:dTDP-4-dehydrorhamnose reductase